MSTGEKTAIRDQASFIALAGGRGGFSAKTVNLSDPPLNVILFPLIAIDNFRGPPSVSSHTYLPFDVYTFNGHMKVLLLTTIRTYRLMKLPRYSLLDRCPTDI